MSTNGNLPPSPIATSTTAYFNNFFTEGFTTSPNINDAIVGYFQTVTGDVDSGKTLAATVIYTALSQGIEPMSLIDEFRKLGPGELNSYLTVLLNSNRVGTSLLGISNSPQINKYIQRAILP
jgi:hypothetical protein